MKHYDFEAVQPRRGTGSMKWAEMEKYDCPEGVIPFSVADMELKVMPEVVDGLKEFLDKSPLGYCNPDERFNAAVCRWERDRHGWDIRPEWLLGAPASSTPFYRRTCVHRPRRRRVASHAGILSNVYGRHAKRPAGRWLGAYQHERVLYHRFCRSRSESKAPGREAHDPVQPAQPPAAAYGHARSSNTSAASVLKTTLSSSATRSTATLFCPVITTRPSVRSATSLHRTR